MKRSLIMSTAAVVTGLTLFATACANDTPAGKKDASGGSGGQQQRSRRGRGPGREDASVPA
ncbi:hypothetical protein AB0O22_10255 [Streptomyces sp. NPDC091204]|uniref:hypothetical protein n=1 Tax=Streptomyces sp. NPDC091204 TaxID=3155299 RepID=UPI00343B0F4B